MIANDKIAVDDGMFNQPPIARNLPTQIATPISTYKPYCFRERNGNSGANLDQHYFTSNAGSIVRYTKQ